LAFLLINMSKCLTCIWMFFLHRFLWNYLLLLLVWLPIPLGSNRPWAWLIFELSSFSILLGCVLLKWHCDGLGLTKYKTSIYLWLAFLFICLLQIFPLPVSFIELISPNRLEDHLTSPMPWYYLSSDLGQSQVSFIKSLGYFGIFLSCLMLIDDEKHIRRLLLVLLLSGTFQAVYGVLEVLSDNGFSLVFDLPIDESATGSFVYKNHFANFLLLCLSAGIGLMITDIEINKSQKSQDWRISLLNTILSSKTLIRICIAIMVIALVMSRSRMGNVAFFSAMIAVGAFALLLDRKKSKGLLILLVSMLIIDLFIVSQWFGLQKVQQRLAETSLSQETRDEVVLDSLPIVKNHPIIGSGAGSYYSIFPGYKNSILNSFYDYAHNDYLQIIIEYGVLGFTVLGILVLFSFIKAMTALKKNASPLSKGTAFACLMAYLGMLIHMSVDFPLQAPANAVYFVIFIALPMVSNNIIANRQARN
jgi:putative inorganic carbon (HCO3(-)) transporter